MTPRPETGAEPTAPVAEISPVDAEAVEAAVQAALAAYEAAADLDELKAARLAHTGDRAPLTLANKAIGALPKERKAEAGKLMGAARGRLGKALAARTEVLEAEPLRRLALRARGWPMGEAKVVLELEELGSTTNVRIIEDATAGPGLLMPAPLRHSMIKVRNVEALGRLAHLVEGTWSGMATAGLEDALA